MKRSFLVKLGVAAALLVLAGGGAAGAVAVARASAVTPAVAVSSDVLDKQNTNGAWLGLALANLNDQLARRLGLVNHQTGVVILKVVPGSPADQAGLKQKDVVTTVGTAAVTDVKGVQQAISSLKPGDAVNVTVVREQSGQADTTLTVTLTAAQRPLAPDHPKRPGMKPGGLLGMPLWLSELQGILPADLFTHFLSAQYALTDKDGNPITVNVAAGTVTQSSGTSLTIQLNGANAGTKTFSVTGDTKVMSKGGKAENLTTGQQVIVVTVGAGTDARAIMAVPNLPAGGKPGQNHERGQGPKRQGHFFQESGIPGEMRDHMKQLGEQFRERLPQQLAPARPDGGV